jgi:NTP pyrophosphatase (non-canonical NTP hydrolase)
VDPLALFQEVFRDVFPDYPTRWFRMSCRDQDTYLLGIYPPGQPPLAVLENLRLRDVNSRTAAHAVLQSLRDKVDQTMQAKTLPASSSTKAVGFGHSERKLADVFAESVRDQFSAFFGDMPLRCLDVEIVNLVDRIRNGIWVNLDSGAACVSVITDGATIYRHGIRPQDVLAALYNLMNQALGLKPVFPPNAQGLTCIIHRVGPALDPKAPQDPPTAHPAPSPITLAEYVAFTRTTACNPGALSARRENLNYLALGLCSEAGEVAGKLKKILRGDPDRPTNHDIMLELGDVLWYAFRLADDLGYTPECVLSANRTKLQDRKVRQVLKGSGDAR